MDTLNFLQRLWTSWRITILITIWWMLFILLMLNAHSIGPVVMILIMISPLIALGVWSLVDVAVSIMFAVTRRLMREDK